MEVTKEEIRVYKIPIKDIYDDYKMMGSPQEPTLERTANGMELWIKTTVAK